MNMIILSCLRGFCSAVVLTGAAAILQAPAEAQRADAIHFAAGTKTDATTLKTIEKIKSVPPRKRNRCYG